MPRRSLFRIFILILFLTASCKAQGVATPHPTQTELSKTPTDQVAQGTTSEVPDIPPMTPDRQSQFADILSVQVTGNPGAYQFAVKVASPDTGCEQFADWWEVFDEEGKLLYRRILLHSHVGEQPFTRSGGPVDIAADEVVYVRAHMNTVGYGGLLMKGTVQNGFEPVEVEAPYGDDTGFGSDLEHVPPQPEDCAF